MHELRRRTCKVQFALFGFRARLPLHLVRSLLEHSAHYAAVRDRPTCFASYTLTKSPVAILNSRKLAREGEGQEARNKSESRMPYLG